MYAKVDKPKENKSRAVANSVAQNKNNGRQGFELVDNRVGITTQLKSYSNINANVKQLKGDKHYWVRPDGGQWTYVGAFKSHAEANQWWAANKSSYLNGFFSQGNSKTKFK